MMRKKRLLWLIPVGLALVLALTAAVADRLTEPLAHHAPDYERQSLDPLIAAGDTRALLLQTGLAPAGLERVGMTRAALLPYQDALFADVSITCFFNSLLSEQETMAEPAPMVPLEDGDVLITPCSHVSGWRNGHAAIVTDAQNGITLESIVLGQPSSEQNAADWCSYPAFLVFRLKDTSAATRAAIARDAVRNLTGIPYGFTAGLLTPKYRESEPPRDTQCAHLVWHAFRRFGYDLDGDGGRIVTPRDLANSPLLELVQVYGMDPDRLWAE